MTGYEMIAVASIRPVIAGGSSTQIPFGRVDEPWKLVQRDNILIRLFLYLWLER